MDESVKQLDIVRLIPTSMNLFNNRGIDPGATSLRHEFSSKLDEPISTSSTRLKQKLIDNTNGVWNSLDTKTDTL